MALSAQAAYWFLPFVTPIAIWVAWSDMKWMKIHNYAVFALVAVYLIIGPIALPLPAWAWGWVSLGLILVVGFALSSVGLLGAGDAKFAAAMAPFVALGDLGGFMLLLAGVIVVSFAAHRVVRRLPAIVGRAPDWESWHRRDFPLGLALGPGLLAYVALAAFSGTSF